MGIKLTMPVTRCTDIGTEQQFPFSLLCTDMTSGATTTIWILHTVRTWHHVPKVKMVKGVPSFPNPCIHDLNHVQRIKEVQRSQDSSDILLFDSKVLQYRTTCHFISKLNCNHDPLPQGILSNILLVSVRDEQSLLTLAKIFYPSF